MAQQIKIDKIITFLKTKRIIPIIQILLVLIIVFNVGSVLWQNRQLYTYNYWSNFPKLEKIFLNSQYVNKHPVWIRDEVAFSYAGGKLIKGTNPVLVVPDAPPLGKYIIGLSTIIFNNAGVFVALSGILSLVLLYFLSLQIYGSRTLSLLPPLFVSFEQIFKNQFIYTPLLDLFQLLFLLCGFLFFNKALRSKNSLFLFLLSNIFLGLFISTKFFVTGLVIVAAYYLVLFLSKEKKRIIQYSLSLPVAIFILLFSYVRVFAFGYNIHAFLGIQKWVFLYHKSFLILPFSIWPLLLFNQWHVWFGNKPVISDSQWSITWPFITSISLIVIIFYIFKKIPHNKNIEVLMIWSIFYLLFFSVGEITSRYFVILIPVLYVISIYGLIEAFKFLKKFLGNFKF